MLFFHQNNHFEAKTTCFADFSILTKIAVSGPYRRGHFVGWFFWLSFSNVENALPILLKHSKCCSFIKTISLKQKQDVLLTFQFWPKSLYPDLSDVAILLVDFFGWFFEMLKIPFQFFWNIKMLFFHQTNQHVLRTFQLWRKLLYPELTGVAIFLLDFLKCWKYPSNSSETFKMLFFHQNNQHVLRRFQFWRKSLYRTWPIFMVDFFGWVFWNVENTLPILLKHSKCCSFIKTTSLKQKQHVLRTFQFWPKSLYPDITGVAILLVDFFGWFFEMLKIPFQFFWNIQNVVLS